MYRNVLLASTLLVTGLLSAQQAPEAVPAPAIKPAAPAQDYSTWSLKGRLQLGTHSSDGVENGVGIGVNYAIPAGPGLFNAELNYQQFFGSNYIVSVPANTFGANYLNSADDHKHSLSGYALRLGYQQPFNQSWSWQAGVSVNYYRVTDEAHAQFGGYGAAGYWDEDLEKSRVTLAPFAGARLEVSDWSAFEFNLFLLSYRENNVYPVVGQYQFTSATDTRSMTALKFEFGYVLKF
jgi:hypothetical protein